MHRVELAGCRNQALLRGLQLVLQRLSQADHVGCRTAQGFNSLLDQRQPLFGLGQGSWDLLAAVLRTCLDQLQQPHAGIGKGGDFAVSASQQCPPGGQPLGQACYALAEVLPGIAGEFGNRLDALFQRLHLRCQSFTLGGGTAGMLLLALLPACNFLVDQTEPASKACQRCGFALIQCLGHGAALLTQDIDTRSQGHKAIRLLGVKRTACAVNFAGQRLRPGAYAGHGFGFIGFELFAELGSLIGHAGKAAGSDAFQLYGFGAKLRQSRRDQLPQRFDLALAGLAEFVEPLETADHFLQLGVGCAAGIANIVGHVASGIGDNRELSAELFHIFQRRFAHPPDGFNLSGIGLDERLQAICALRQTIARDSAQRIEIARLRGDEFSRQT